MIIVYDYYLELVFWHLKFALLHFIAILSLWSGHDLIVISHAYHHIHVKYAPGSHTHFFPALWLPTQASPCNPPLTKIPPPLSLFLSSLALCHFLRGHIYPPPPFFFVCSSKRKEDSSASMGYQASAWGKPKNLVVCWNVTIFFYVLLKRLRQTGGLCEFIIIIAVYICILFFLDCAYCCVGQGHSRFSEHSSMQYAKYHRVHLVLPGLRTVSKEMWHVLM